MEGLKDWEKTEEGKENGGNKEGNKRQRKIRVETKRGGRKSRDNIPETIKNDDRKGR